MSSNDQHQQSTNAAPDPADDLSLSPPRRRRSSSHSKQVAVVVPPLEEDEDFRSFSQTAVLDVDHPIVATAEDAASSSDGKKNGAASPPQTDERGGGDNAAATDTPSAHPSTTTTSSSSNVPPKRYVTPQDFTLLKVIGMGAFGKVLQVRSRSTSSIHAMKVISKRRLRHKAGYIENIQAEREILTKIDHPFVVKMHCSFQTKEKLFIVMDFLAGGELFLRLGRNGIFLEKTARFYLAEILLALEHLHSRGILHRDLKPENILLGADGHLVLTDFGLAKDFRWDNHTSNGEDDNDHATTICGTTEYMAPEMVARKGYTKAADYWSLGCIAYEMLSGRPPFQSRKGAKDLFRKIMEERVRMPDGASAGACELLKGLLKRDAVTRLGASKGTMFTVGGVSAVKVLKFFHGLDWTKLERKEIEPPEILELDGDHDLRHFYDEFTNMKLPRSVQEISAENFKPRRCESNMFRGFSYIQEDFVLPERSDNQQEHYWNNCDEDGESRSDCASSKFGDEDNDPLLSEPQPITLESTPEAEEPVVPAKKKRVRKKKKKKPAETEGEKEDAGNTNGCTTTATATATATATTTAATTTTATDGDVMQTETQRQLEETKRKKSNDTPQSNTDTSEPHTVAITSNGHPPQRAAPQSMPITPAISTPKPTTRVERPPPPTWETVGSHKPSSRTIQAPSKPAHQTHQPKQQQPAVPTRWNVPIATPKKITPPQTWETVGKQRTMPSRATGVARDVPVTGKTTNSVAMGWGRPGVRKTTASGVGTEIGVKKPETSGNWRDHKMSRGVSGGARHKKDEAGPPPLQTELWPTLGGSKVGSSNTISAAPKVDMGRWGSKNAGTNIKKSRT